MIGHPDADALAACREGLLGGRRSARIRAHLARCSRCASLDHELAAVTTLLASAPAPPIPDELAARLDTVLAAESAARARGESSAVDGIPAAVDAAGDGVRATGDGVPATAGAANGRTGGDKAGPRPGRPRPARPPRPWRVTALRVASVTAALLVIAGGGYGVSRLVQAGSTGTTSSASHGSAGSAAGGSSAPASPGGYQSRTAPGGAGNRVGGSRVPVVQSSTDYQPGRLAVQAKTALATHRARFGGAASSVSPPSDFPLDGCLKTFAGGRATLVDQARYRGQPATVIIRAPAGRQPGRVWVIAPSCSAPGRHLIAQASLPASG